MGVLVSRSRDLGSSDAQRAGTQSGYRAIARAAASMGSNPSISGRLPAWYMFLQLFYRIETTAACDRRTLGVTAGQGSYGPSGEGLGRSGTAEPFDLRRAGVPNRIHARTCRRSKKGHIALPEIPPSSAFFSPVSQRRMPRRSLFWRGAAHFAVGRYVTVKKRRKL